MAPRKSTHNRQQSQKQLLICQERKLEDLNVGPPYVGQGSAPNSAEELTAVSLTPDRWGGSCCRLPRTATPLLGRPVGLRRSSFPRCLTQFYLALPVLFF